MSIRLKIILHQLVVAIMLLSSTAATYIAIERIDYYFDRTRIARQQMDTALRLSAHMNRYSENIAELLLLGRTELDDFYAARSSLEDGLARLTTLVEDEIDFVRTAAERAAETEELARVNKMRELFENIDLRSGSSKSMQARLRSRAIPRVSPSWSSGCRSLSRTGGRRSRRSILPKRCKPNPPAPSTLENPWFSTYPPDDVLF